MKRWLSLVMVGVLVLAAAVARPGGAWATTLDLRLSPPDATLEAALRAASLTGKLLEEETASPADLLAAARADYRQLVSVLYAAGYYSGAVSLHIDGVEAAEMSPFAAPARIGTILIRVERGRQFRFGRAEIGPLAPGTALPEGWARGQPAASGLIGAAARAGVEGWRAAGHPRATLGGQQIVADHATRQIDARLELVPGPRLRFGPLVITGESRVRESRIRAIAGLPEGEVYDPEAVITAADRLRRSGAFRAVSLTDAAEDGPDGTLPMVLDLVDDRRRRLGFGAELSSTEGILLSAFWIHRNLLGGAERLNLDFEIRNIAAPDAGNGVDYILAGSLRRPAVPDPDTDLLIKSELRHDDEPGYVSDSFEVGAGLIRRLNPRLEGAASLGFATSRVEDAFGPRSLSLALVPLRLTWDGRDRPLDAAAGSYVNLETTPFVGFGDTASGLYTILDGRAYRDLGTRQRLVLAGRAQLGSLLGPEIDESQPDFLFFAGGGGTVRGQPYQAVGSGTVDGTVVGGRSWAGVSAELRAQVRGPIGLAGFVDAARVSAAEFPDAEQDWLTGAGLGLRYETGFGPLRVDLAVPTGGGPADAPRVQLYIGLGQAF